MFTDLSATVATELRTLHCVVQIIKSYFILHQKIIWPTVMNILYTVCSCEKHNRLPHIISIILTTYLVLNTLWIRVAKPDATELELSGAVKFYALSEVIEVLQDIL